MSIRHHPRRRLIRRALSGHHVSRDRPWRAAESDQRNLRSELAPHPAQRLEHRFKLGKIGVGRERPDFVGRIQRVEPGTFADLEPDGTAERVGDHQNVREDDRGIEVEAPDRLQRYFGGEFRGEAEIEEAAGFGADFAIFRQIAAGLAHHPERGHCLAVAREHLDEGFDGRILCQVSFPLPVTSIIVVSDTLMIRSWPTQDWGWV